MDRHTLTQTEYISKDKKNFMVASLASPYVKLLQNVRLTQKSQNPLYTFIVYTIELRSLAYILNHCLYDHSLGLGS